MFNGQRVALAGRRGHVADTHSTAWKPAPDLGMVLVRWADQTLSWEYSDELRTEQR